MIAGPRVAYQHYLPPWRLPGEAPAWSLAVVLLELGAVGVAAWRMGPGLTPPAWLRGWPLLILGAGFVLTSATLSRNPAEFAAELVLASLLQLLHLATAILAVLSLPPASLDRLRGRLDRWVGPPPAAPGGAEPGGPDRFALSLAAAFALVAVILAAGIYQRHPHVPDEVVYLLQARYLAAGQLAMPLPPVVDAFNIDLMTYQDTRWFSPVPPGWPFILAIGAFLGAPWLVNPLLGGVNILLAYVFLRELYPRRTARLTLVLLAASPWHLFMAMNLMTHTATMTAALVAAAAVARLQRDPRARWAVIGGIGIGVAGLIRPLEGIAIALVLGVWSLWARGPRLRLGPSAVLTRTSLVIGGLVLPYNRALTGSAQTFPIMAYNDALYGPGSNALGFGANRGMPWPGLDPLPGHGPLDVLINSNLNLFQTNIELFGWATGSLLILLLLVPHWRRLGRAEWGMVGVIAVVVALHALYYFSGGPDFGARYWYLILLPCVALTVRGLEILDAQEAPAAGDSAGRPLALAAALTVVALAVFVPWRAVDKYHHYRGMRPDVRELAADPTLAGDIVLIRGNRHPDFASAAIYNPLDLTAPSTIFAWDRGDTVRRQLVDAYPGRRFWIVEGPTVSGNGFVVTAGPLDAAALLSRRDSLIP